MFDLKAIGNFLRSLPVVASLFATREDSHAEMRRALKIIERRLAMEGAFLFKQKPEYDERKIVYHGWIKAYPEQRGILMGLGARELEYREDGSYFSCVCGKAAMEALMLGFPTFWPGCFTACIGDEQLPHALQEYWHYPVVIVSDDDRIWYRKWRCRRCDADVDIERRRCGNCMAYRTSLDVDLP